MATPDRLFNRVVVGAIAFGFIALIIVGLTGSWAILQAQSRAERIAHTYEVENAIQNLETLSERVETARRGYLLQADPRFLTTFAETEAQLAPLLERIAVLTADNTSQRNRLADLRDLSARQIEIARTSLDARRDDPNGEAGTLFAIDNGADLLRSIRAITAAMIEEEDRLLAARSAQQRFGDLVTYIILATAGVLLVLVAGGTIWFINRNMREVTRSRNTLRGLNEMLEGAVKVRTADLQRANEEIQRFAYIVSHDLRSPLVNVMGFTSELDAAIAPLSQMIERAEERAPEIVTEEARLAVKEDLPEAIGFIRTSTQKMDRLINAILRLSREGRRVITPEPLDMTAMMSSIADSLQHRLSEVGAEIRIEEPLPGIVSDRVAVEQIFSNLVENAVKYLKRGRPGIVSVRGRKAGSNRVIFEVEDNGRGIDPKDHERVFDLFRRSGTQDQPGEGIGLAHVRALAYRLGGVVDCESALDQGATFRLSMPAKFEAAKEARS